MLAASVPTNFQIPFANSAGGSYVRNIPVASQIGITPGAASLTDGFPPLNFTPIAGGGVPFSGLDVNGIFKQVTQNIQWWGAGGEPQYNSAFSTAIGGYPNGAFLQAASFAGWWLSTADNNTSNPETGGANWVPRGFNGITSITMTNANVTLTLAQYAMPIIVITGVLAANVQLIFPNIVGQWLIVNNTTGAFTITAKTAAGLGSNIPNGEFGIYGDGTNIFDATISQSAADVRYTVAVQDFRLTLTTGTPVTTADVTAATTLYCTPYTGNHISLWNGTTFQNYISAEFSIALGTLVSGKAYDVFCYQNAGVPTLELGTAWTNDTTRAVALAYQNGILVKSGDATRRYLGTFYTTATTTTEDSVANRYLWNYYNRVARSMRRIETTASWAYTTATYRQANGSAANQLNFILGIAEDEVSGSVLAMGTNTSAGVFITTGIALDSTTTPSRFWQVPIPVASYNTTMNSGDTYIPSAGRHYLAWLEQSQAAGASTFYGSGYGSGIIGRVMA